MKDLDLYADLFENDLEGEDAVHNIKDTDYVNRILYKNSALQTELEALQARNSRLEVERNQLLAAKDQISDNFVRLGLACRQEIAKLKQRVLWLCKRVKVKEPKFSSFANSAAPQSCEMNLEKPVMYSTLLAYLHTNQLSAGNCEAVTAVSCSDPLPKVAVGPSVTSSMSLRSIPAPLSTFKPTEPPVGRRQVSRSCSSSSSSSCTSRSSSSSSSTSSSVSSHLSSASHASVSPSTTHLRPTTIPSSTTTKATTDGPQRNQPSTSDVLPVDNKDSNPFSYKPMTTSPFTKRKQVVLNDRKGHYNRECTNNRRGSQNDLSPRGSQHRLDDRSKPITPLTCDKSKSQTGQCFPLNASSHKTGPISAASHNRSKTSASKIASYDEWEANRATRSRGIRHPPSRDRSCIDENRSKHIPHHSSDDRFTSVNEIRDRQHLSNEMCVKYRSPESRQTSKSTVKSESSANLSQEKLATKRCKQRKPCRNEDSGLGLSTEDCIRRQLLSLVQHSVCQAREHHAVRRSRQPPLTVTVVSNAAVQMADPRDTFPGEQEASMGRRRRTPRSHDSTSPTVYTKRFRSRREQHSTTAAGHSSPAPAKGSLVASNTTCAEEPSQTRVVSTSPLVLLTPASAARTGQRRETIDDEVVTIPVERSSASLTASLTDTLSNTVPMEGNNSSSGDCVLPDWNVAHASTVTSVPLTSGELVKPVERNDDGDPSAPQTYSKGEEANDSEPTNEIGDQLELTAQPEEGDDQWSSWDEVLQPVGDQSQMTDTLGQGSEIADDHRAPSGSGPDEATVDDEHKEEGEIADDDYEDDARDELAERHTTAGADLSTSTSRQGKQSWSDDSEQDRVSESVTGGGGGGGVNSPNWLADKRYRRHAADYPGVRPESRPEDNRSGSSTNRRESTGEHRNRRRRSKSKVMAAETYGQSMWRGVENAASRTLNHEDRQSRAKPRSPPSPASPRDTHRSSSGSPLPKPIQKQRDSCSKTSNQRDSSISPWYARRRPRRRRSTSPDGDEPESAGATRLPDHHGEARRRYGFTPPDCPSTSGDGQRQFRPRQSARRWSPAPAGKAARFPQHRREPEKPRTASGSSRASRSPSDQRHGGLQYAGGKPWGNRENRRQVVHRPPKGGYYSPSSTSQPPPPHRPPCSSSSSTGGAYRHAAGLSQRRRPLPARVGGSRLHRRF